MLLTRPSLIRLRAALTSTLAIALIAATLLAPATPPTATRTAAAAALAPGPTLTFSTYLGGRSDDTIRAVTTDSTGIYVVGETYSDDLAGFNGGLKGRADLFVAKVNPDGSALVWGTYLGGSANETAAGIALDGRGGVWVVGSSNSADFPATSDALQGTNSGGYDAILAELDAATGAFRYGSYYGEAGTDEARAITTDGLGHLLITGQGGADVMAIRIEAASHVIAYSGYFGGSGEDGGYAVAAGPRGYAFITGATDGVGTTFDFPLIEPLQANCGLADDAGSCGQDAFVTAITPDGQLVYSTLLGGSYAGSEISSGGDIGKAIAVDPQGHIYVAGTTYAADFPTVDAIQDTRAGQDTFADGFLAKIAPDGASLLFSTYLGGTQHDELRTLQVDAQGNAYVTGFSGSRDFPVKDALQASLGNGICGIGGIERFCEDAVVAKFAPSGALTWSTYLGGGLDDYSFGLALASTGHVLVVGSAASSAGQGFPATAGSLQPTKSLNVDGFIVRFDGASQGTPPPGNLPYRVSLPLVRR
ncbi:SBBP repeat-containing protein [Candidatus Chloroploca sp. Khr17]|uniref:SBBP repeat-containing protein n=1 Tax=Candidatus Chloroploca sp. Khr17 TaxID=2496869 RepID=UPI00101B5D07|nr:SBBP repeat-containing protein [Candidatus Chloroploca sp. Khr17]